MLRVRGAGSGKHSLGLPLSALQEPHQALALHLWQGLTCYVGCAAGPHAAWPGCALPSAWTCPPLQRLPRLQAAAAHPFLCSQAPAAPGSAAWLLWRGHPGWSGADAYPSAESTPLLRAPVPPAHGKLGAFTHMRLRCAPGLNLMLNLHLPPSPWQIPCKYYAKGKEWTMTTMRSIYAGGIRSEQLPQRSGCGSRGVSSQLSYVLKKTESVKVMGI